MALTDNGKFMHCLPVRRNMKVADEVLDGPRSFVIEQAANRRVVGAGCIERGLVRNVIAIFARTKIGRGRRIAVWRRPHHETANEMSTTTLAQPSDSTTLDAVRKTGRI